MKLIRNIAVAFSLYSQIPMPIFKWEEDDMKHNLVFLPWIGAVIGGLCALITWLFKLAANDLQREIPLIAQVAIYALIPLIVTGGFHVDGFMDVQDALKSYKPREVKLKILKDPNIGAFAIINLLKYSLVWGAAVAIVLFREYINLIYILFTTYFTARALTGIVSLTLKHAKKDGMLNMETNKSNRGDLIALIIEFVIGCAVMLWFQWLAAAMVIAGILAFTAYYRHVTYKEFGGVTGDTSGYFLVMAEGIAAVLLAASTFII